MISLKLWRALSKPPRRHPLFQYVLLDAKREQPRITSGFVIWAMMFATIIFTFSIILRPVAWVILGLFMALNSIYAARWVLRIARTLTHEKETHRYDLFAALPVGLLGTSWALSTGALHRRSSFRWIPYLVLVIAIVTFIALCGLSTVTLTLIDTLSDSDKAFVENLAFARGGIAALPFIILFYIDHVYSILTAIVFGQLATVDIKNTADGQIRALFGFLTIQILTYVATAGLVIVIIPNVFTVLDVNSVQPLIVLSVIGIIIFIALREAIVFTLWQMLTRLLDADNKEIALVLKPFYEAELILRESEKARARHIDTP
ncbi:MAG: hypothetical protein WBC91_05070 [Phototrophicaceae bacterium]